jgi:hypothetical protein
MLMSVIKEYHNWITVQGSPEHRLAVMRDLLASTPPNRGWVGVEINSECGKGTGQRAQPARFLLQTP